MVPRPVDEVAPAQREGGLLDQDEMITLNRAVEFLKTKATYLNTKLEETRITINEWTEVIED